MVYRMVIAEQGSADTEGDMFTKRTRQRSAFSVNVGEREFVEGGLSFPPFHGHPKTRENARGVSHVSIETSEQEASRQAEVHA